MQRVAILAPAWFDPAGQEICQGGAERYLAELCRLLRDMNYHVEVFQAASRDWTRTHESIPVHGLSPVVVIEDTWPRTNQRFQEASRSFDHQLYFSWPMAFPQARAGSLAVSHSLWWDDPSRPRRTARWAERIRQALAQPARIIANDTNIINWVRATDPDLEAKFTFIPNFVDLDQFCPGPARLGADPFTVLFPRRLEHQKGLVQAVEAAKRLTAAHDDIAFHFVGRGPAEAERQLQALAQANPRIRHSWRTAGEMPAVYQQADLVLLPTVAAEGTSLSCLEAMACGVPVIAGRVGGMANLIIQEYNGLLVEARTEELIQAILRVKGDPDLRGRWSARSREVAAVHSLSRWRERWAAVIASHWSVSDRVT
ncbi:MAG: glycosyltransferase family 4 protein [Bacillota bacterium]